MFCPKGHLLRKEGDVIVCAGGEYRYNPYTDSPKIDVKVKGTNALSRQAILDMELIHKPIEETWLRDRSVKDPQSMKLVEEAIAPNIGRFLKKYGVLPEQLLGEFLCQYLKKKGLGESFEIITLPVAVNVLRCPAARIVMKRSDKSADELPFITLAVGSDNGFAFVTCGFFYGIKASTSSVKRMLDEDMINLTNDVLSKSLDLNVVVNHIGSEMWYLNRSNLANPRWIEKTIWSSKSGIASVLVGERIPKEVDAHIERILTDIWPIYSRLSEC